MKFSFLFRSRVILFCLILFSLVLMSKLFLVQIMHGGAYGEEANRQYATPSSNIYERGTIYFMRKDGEPVSAATQTSGFKLAIEPTKIIDFENTYKKMSDIVAISRDDFLAKALKKNDPYEEVASHLSKEEADAVSELKLSGENINKTLFQNGVREGDVITTIEPSVQDFLEKKLRDVKEKYQVDSIGGIIMNPMDGSIYALGVKPDFDPNNFSKVKSTNTFSNPLVESVLEFGSVVKPLVMAAALDAKVLTPETTYTDNGSVIVENKEIFNFDKKARGPNTSMQEVLNQSLNTGMVFVEKKLGKELLREYLLSYGIKDKTGIDLPNETSGLVSNILNSPREIEYANAAFGQGIALTPVELIRALATLANGGILVTPHVVKEIKYNDGTHKSSKYPTMPAKITKATSEEITRMLVTVMDKAIKSGLGKLEHFSVAVKTGTAQVADNTTGGYYTDRHTHSFVGYFPAYGPKFIVFLYAVNPRGVEYAATTWTDAFLDITKFLLNYYEIPPDR